jgi:hypothetical protein
MQGMKAGALGFKDEKKEKELYAKFAKDFRKENKDVLDAREKMVSLKGILDKTPDRVGVEMAKTGLLKFAGEDRVSDADVARAQRDPSLRAGIARRLKLNQSLRKKVKGFSSGTAELAEIDGSKLESGLVKQLGLPDDAKTIAKKMYSPKRNATKFIYSDGTEEEKPGRQ